MTSSERPSERPSEVEFDTSPDRRVETPDGDDPSGSSSVLQRIRRIPPIWWLPIAVGLVVLIATTFRLSGSSVAQLAAVPGDDDGIVTGSPRPIRSDEWAVRTPFIVNQADQGFPRMMRVGLGSHDASVLYDLPVADWPTVFRPHLWGYFALPVEHGFAFEWWLLAGVLILGVYLLVGVSTGRWGWAAIAGLAVYGSPFFHWWYLPATLGTVGYGAGAVGALLWALRQPAGRRRWAGAGLAWYLTTCFALLFYPPFQIPVIWVLAAWFCATITTARWKDHRSPRELALVAGPVAFGSALVMALFVVTRSEAIAAITSSVYPGDRRATGGEGLTGLLGSAWLGWSYISDADALRGKVFPNESEGSSFLLLGVFALPALPFVWRAVASRRSEFRWHLVALTSVVTGLVAHCFVGLPAPLLRVSLLDRVPAARAMIGLGFGSVLLVVALGLALEQVTLPRWRRLVSGGLVAALGGGYVLTLAGQLRDAGAVIEGAFAWLPVLAVVLLGFVLFNRPGAAVAGLAALGLVVSVPVNPVFQGLGPVRDNALVRSVERADRTQPGGRPWWIASGDKLTTGLTAAGVANLSGVNLYPDASEWKLLDPTGASEEVWNRYAHTIWTLTPGAIDARITLVQPDLVSVEIDPCAAGLDALRVGHIVSATELNGSCLRLETRTETLGGSGAYLYERVPGARDTGGK